VDLLSGVPTSPASAPGNALPAERPTAGRQVSDRTWRRVAYEEAVVTGVQEVPVVSTTGSGTLRAEISKDGDEIEYTLSFSNLEG
jgi:hypothetical protein